jgi:hypothetical protein
MQKSTLSAIALTAGTATLVGACVVASKMVHARNMRRALATAKAQTTHHVLGGYLDHTPIVDDAGTISYQGGVIIDRAGTRDVLPFTYIETTNQIKRSLQ